MTQLKHADMFEALLNGCDIQYRHKGSVPWCDTSAVNAVRVLADAQSEGDEREFRVKPKGLHAWHHVMNMSDHTSVYVAGMFTSEDNAEHFAKQRRYPNGGDWRRATFIGTLHIEFDPETWNIRTFELVKAESPTGMDEG